MSESRGKMGLMALAMLVPVVVIVGVLTSGQGGNQRAWRGGTSARRTVAKHGSSGRRLQTATFDFATQTELTVCLTTDHTTESASSTGDQFKTAMIEFFEIENTEFVKVDETLTRCTVDGWQRRVSIYNEGTDTLSAADIASAQVDSIFPNSPDPKTTEFFTSVAASITAQDSELVPEAEDFDLESLGFLVIWLDSSGDVVSSQGTSDDKDVVSIGGTDVWWPWWAWLIYAAVVLCCICPLLFFFFKWRRDKEAEMEGYGGKDLGTPAPPSATSTNPYGGQYTSGEEYKTGKN